MSPLTRFWHLTAEERRLVTEAVVLVTAVRLGLSVLGFRPLRRVLARLGHHRVAVPLSSGRIGWAVRAAARRVPRARTCLVEAIAAETLLARHGYTTQLRIGVARSGAGIDAHAWLEQDGRPVFGHPGPLHAGVLPPIDL